MSIWATKSIAALRAEADASSEHGPATHPLGVQPGVPRHRRHHRRRHLRAHRGRRRAACRPGGADLHGHRGHRLHARRPLLRRDGEHGAGGGQRLHLLVRHHGRAGGVDHRLGPGARVRDGRGDGGGRLVGSPGEPARHLRHPHPGRSWRRRRTSWCTGPNVQAAVAGCAHVGMERHRLAHQPPGDPRVRADDHRAGHRHQGVGRTSTT